MLGTSSGFGFLSELCSLRLINQTPKLIVNTKRPIFIGFGIYLAGNGLHFPQSEYVVIDEGMDPGSASARNALSPDSESLSSSQIERGENSSRNYLERKSNWRSVVVVAAAEEGEGSSKEICFESASDSDIYSQKEGEDVCIQKHILVEDHLPSSISLTDGLHLRKRTNSNLDDDDITDYHEEYVIV